MTTEKKESLLNKIKALLDKANSTDSQAEAETFIAHANKLLTEHNLSMSQVENLSNKEEVGETEKMALHQQKGYGTYDKGIITTLAKYNFCDIIYWSGNRFSLVGEKTNVDTVIYLFNYLKAQLPRIGMEKYNNKFFELREAYKVHNVSKEEAADVFNEYFPELNVTIENLTPKSFKEGAITDWSLKDLKLVGLSDRLVYLRSFLLGCAKGLRDRLEVERKKAIQESEQQKFLSGNSTALTVQSLIKVKSKEIDTFILKQYPNIKYTSSKGESANDSGAFGQGVKTGKEINLGGGVSSSTGGIQKRIG